MIVIRVDLETLEQLAATQKAPAIRYWPSREVMAQPSSIPRDRFPVSINQVFISFRRLASFLLAPLDIIS
jgi:hypothetical protein